MKDTDFFDCRFCGRTAGVNKKTRRAFHQRPACPEFLRFAESVAPVDAEAKTYRYSCRFCGGTVEEVAGDFARAHDDTPCEMFERHRDSWNSLMAKG